MEYQSLTRKQLQALCKKHGVPANLSNSEMADRLSSILKVRIFFIQMAGFFLFNFCCFLKLFEFHLFGCREIGGNEKKCWKFQFF